jgi:hypothetical protein
MVPRDVKAANPFHSLAALQKLAHHASFLTALAVAFPRDHDLHSTVQGCQLAHNWIFCALFKSHPPNLHSPSSRSSRELIGRKERRISSQDMIGGFRPISWSGGSTESRPTWGGIFRDFYGGC